MPIPNFNAFVKKLPLDELQKEIVELSHDPTGVSVSSSNVISLLIVANQLKEASEGLRQMDKNLQAQIVAMGNAQDQWQASAAKISKSLALATWALVVVTGILCLITLLSVSMSFG